jgi:hypothetical protein
MLHECLVNEGKACFMMVSQIPLTNRGIETGQRIALASEFANGTLHGGILPSEKLFFFNQSRFRPFNGSVKLVNPSLTGRVSCGK